MKHFHIKGNVVTTKVDGKTPPEFLMSYIKDIIECIYFKEPSERTDKKVAIVNRKEVNDSSLVYYFKIGEDCFRMDLYYSDICEVHFLSTFYKTKQNKCF